MKSIDPQSYFVRVPGEETGQWPVLIALQGSWNSFFQDRDVPQPTTNEIGILEPPQLHTGISSRIVVGGSADMVANNIAFMLNLADWMVQDEELIQIRAKAIHHRPLLVQGQNLTPWKWLIFGLGFGGLLLFSMFRFLYIRLRTRKEEPIS